MSVAEPVLSNTHGNIPPMTTDTLTALDAHALSDAIHRRTVSCREVMAAYLARIAQRPAYIAAMAKGDPGMRLLLT